MFLRLGVSDMLYGVFKLMLGVYQTCIEGYDGRNDMSSAGIKGYVRDITIGPAI